MLIKTKQIISFLAVGAMLLGTFALAGCGSGKDDGSQTQSGETTQELSGRLTIAGSTSVQPFSEVLAEEFMAIYPQVEINVQGGGSSQGVTAAASGVADIGAASRNVKDDEMTENPDLVIFPIAMDGVAIVVHPSNQVKDITQEDVKNIYVGNIKNWKEVGGEDAPITVVSREEGSGTRDAFVSILMDKEEIAARAIIQNSNGAVRTAVAGDPNSIGYVSLAVVNGDIKVLDIEGVVASAENIKAGTYKISRPFIYITNNPPEGLAKAFIDFVLSDEGQKIIVDEGAISVK
ncbi:phosphate abc transporter [hydrocarbon metagenome]|uniref:Phosphate abc transporter n=1 Tax=hydrocarbon metagenome TaxID=938273 RepID=A0A0W8E947_9ZZZZ